MAVFSVHANAVFETVPFHQSSALYSFVVAFKFLVDNFIHHIVHYKIPTMHITQCTVSVFI